MQITTFNDARKEFKRTGDINALVLNCLRVMETNEESLRAIEEAITEDRKGTLVPVEGGGVWRIPNWSKFKVKQYNDNGDIYTCNIFDLVNIVTFVGKVEFEVAKKACYRNMYQGKFYALPLTWDTYIMSFEEGRKYGGER